MSRQRPKRRFSKKIVVFCEGQTEKHYLNGLKKWLSERDPSITVRIEPVDMKGGGYDAALRKLRIEPDSNCIARLVVMDYDRYLDIPSERIAFGQLVQFSQLSMNRQIPTVLVISNANFEYALCCHDPIYRGEDPSSFLKKEWGYGTLGDVKADDRIWDKAHEGERSHEGAMKVLSERPALISNELKIKKSAHSISLSKVSFNEENTSVRSSNLSDLFKVLMFDEGVAFFSGV